MPKINVRSSKDWSGEWTIEFFPAAGDSRRSFVGKEIGSIGVVETPSEAGDGMQRFVRVSLGAAKKLDASKIRRAAGSVSRWMARHEIQEAAIRMELIDAMKIDGARAALCEGLLLGDFRFDRYQSKAGKKPSSAVVLLTDDGETELAATVREAVSISEAVNMTRAWAHEPPNVLNPATLAEWTQKMASKNGLKCTVLDDQALLKLKAGAILAVGGGSSVQPRLIILEWPGKPGAEKAAPVVIVGKAITFDTGGYTLKTRAGLIGSKFDKCGGVAVVGIMKAVAALELKRPVVGIIAAAENAISKEAYRPNDIITTLSGKTVEVISTDAEGRLILADALCYAQKNYKPSALIDIATLTGGIVTALGSVRAGLMSNDDALAQALTDAGRRTHERLWRMPLDDDYFKQIKGTDSDIKNSGGMTATPITGGMFLKQFVDDGVPWAHLDVAGVSTTGRGVPGGPRKATGFGVRLLVDYLRSLEK